MAFLSGAVSYFAGLFADYECAVVSLQWTAEEEKALKDPILKKYEAEGSPYFSTARYTMSSQ